MTVHATATQLPRADEAEYEAFVREWKPLALSFASRLVPPREAEDVVQDACLKLWLAWRPGQTPEHRRHLFLKIVRGVCSNARRAHRRNGAALMDPVLMPLPPEPSCHDVVVQDEWLRGVERAFSNVPERYRRVVHARVLDGESTEELAQRFDMHVVTVRVHKYRGMKWLRERVHELGAPCAAFVGRVTRRAEPSAWAPATQTALASVVVVASIAFAPGAADGHNLTREQRHPSNVRVADTHAEAQTPLSHPATRGAGRVHNLPPAQRPDPHPTRTARRLDVRDLPPPSPGRVCVGGTKCVGRDQLGDEVCITDGQDHRLVCQKQAYVPLCEQVPATTYVTCARTGKPEPIGPGPPAT